MQDYVTVSADLARENDLRLLVRMAIAEDLADAVDWTSVCLLDDERTGGCQIVPRETGVCAGISLLPWIVDEFDADLSVECLESDGDALFPGAPIAKLRGNARDLLASERTILNILSRLCGVASQVKGYVDTIADSRARIYDTRKTTPGWRLLEKYAVACGSGHNHRRGLYDGFLIKDIHLQLGGTAAEPMLPSGAAEKALAWRGAQVYRMTAPAIVEIEVDSLDQLRDVLPTGPDIVLIDNFSLQDIRAAVAIRDRENPSVELEVSGNVKIDTIAAIAATGVASLFEAALAAAIATVAVGAIGVTEARRSIDVNVVLTMAVAIGLGAAISASGLAGEAASVIERVDGLGVHVLAAVTIVSTILLSELLTNTAAAALMVPVGLGVSADLGLDPRLLAVTVLFGASCSFLSPVGYQTNLMVAGLGGYRFRDFSRVGFPLTMTVVVLVSALAPLIYD